MWFKMAQNNKINDFQFFLKKFSVYNLINCIVFKDKHSNKYHDRI